MEKAKKTFIITGKNITVNAFNPGFMADTGLSGSAKSFGERMVKNMAPLLARLLGTHSSAVLVLSGKLLATLVTDIAFDGVTGKYFDRGQEILSSESSYNKANALNLWERSIELAHLQANETIL
jgi:hypothetical protein